MMLLMILTTMMVVVVVIVMIWLQYWGPHRDTLSFLTLDQDSACFKDSQEIYSSDF